LDRIPGLTRDYTASLDRLGIASGSVAAKLLGRVVRELLSANVLPMPDDAEALLPRVVEGLAGRRVVSAYVRRAKGRRLWLWYLPHGEVIELLLVTNSPPQPLE
jgi:hypothetical protein